MSRKRGKKQKAVVAAIPPDILAEGSGPVAVATVEDVGTTDDIATTEDVVTADDVVATADGEPGPAPAPADVVDVPVGIGVAGELRARPSDIVTAAELAEAMEAAGSDDLELGAEGGEVDDELDASGANPDDAIEGDAEAGEGEGEGEGEGHDDDDHDGAIVFPTSAATMDAVQLKHLVEALIFASDRPLTVQRLRQLTRVSDVRRLEQSLLQIAEDYKERGLILQQVSGGYQFRTRTQFSAWVQQLIAGRPVRLSRAQLETLAIIAYRQPITRPEIDDIRGVDSSATLKLLIDRMLIRVLGKREEVGRPMLYGTTKEFLDFFSLGDLRELPTLREYSELTAESRKVMSDRLGIPPDGSGGGGSGAGSAGGGGGSGSGGGSNGGSGSGGGSNGGGGDGSNGSSAGGGIGSSSDGGIGDGEPPDDGGAPAHTSADELGDAMATFLAAADAVDRSDAAALSDPGTVELDADALQTTALDDALELDAIAKTALATDAVELDVIDLQAVAPVEQEAIEPTALDEVAGEAAPLEQDSTETARVEEVAVEPAFQATEAVQVVALEGEAVDAVRVESAVNEELASDPVSLSDVEPAAGELVVDTVLAAADAPVADAPVFEGGRLEDNDGWPAGSQRIARADQPHIPVIAPNDHRPVERPVMNSNVIRAGALDDNHGDAAPAAGHDEPAAE